VDSQLWHCTDCGDERAFVQPACIDGHTEDGGECPEWACTDCGSAVVVGEPVVLTRVVRARIAA
jgi:DNA-directed RNA polymerase subunit RPC12/RpoP